MKEKTAIITGGSRGIGAAIAEKLASLGTNIAVLYAGNTQAAEAVCQKCRDAYGVEAKAYQCDVSDFTAAKETVAQIKADFGTAHILVNYAASKAGLIGLTKSTAKELAPRGIRCNAVAPGFIVTDMTGEQGENPLLQMIPLGRMGEAAEVAEAVAFLAGAKYITGEVLRVDGGIAM